jgi:hypothetical protein
VDDVVGVTVVVVDTVVVVTAGCVPEDLTRMAIARPKMAKRTKTTRVRYKADQPDVAY